MLVGIAASMEIEASSSSSVFQPNGTPSELQPTTLPPSITPQTGTNSFSADSDLRDRIANSNSESVDGRGAAERKSSSFKTRKKRKVLVNGAHLLTTTASSVVGVRGMSVRRSPRIELGGISRRGSEVNALALPLGMSIAAVFAQVLDKREEVDESAYIDDLSEVCALAVKEALDNVFGDKYDCFAGNFEKSFRSTLRTIRLINVSSVLKGRHYRSRQKMLGTHGKRKTLSAEPGSTSDSNLTRQLTHRTKEAHTYETVHSSDETEDCRNLRTDLRNFKLDSDQNMSQELICVGSSRTSSPIDLSVVSTFKKSVVEQTRANDLKACEISLLMEKLKLKETKLALDSESNYLDRFKLSMGLSKASFKAEKFKTQLEDTRHAELLRSCIDCLVGSLLITSGSLVYGAYIHSYKRISEATASCTRSTTSKSWWVPKTFDTFSSGFQMISCQVQVLSRMLFGVLMILAITYLLLQRSAAARQSMPITFILLILGIACGFSGKLCVDTLGGDGYIWLVYWEAMCVIHFLANVFTSSLFTLLYGPITFNLRIRNSTVLSYLSRRVIFYAITLFVLPLTCGLIPFASTDEWKDHFLSLATNAFIS